MPYKYLIPGVMALTLLMGCKEAPKAEKLDVQEVQGPLEVDAHEDHLQDVEKSWIEEISLDQGSKWAANSETTQGVADMVLLISRTQVKTASDYQNLGDGLNEIKNVIVKECTMTGPSHDNLHIWLYPLVEKIGQLQQVESVANGKTLTEEIKGHLDKYYDYFT